MLLFPLRWIPAHPAGAMLTAVSLLATIYAIGKLEGDRLAYVLTFTNPLFPAMLTQANFDALVLLGVVIELRPFDVLLLTVKPQLGWLAALHKLRGYGRDDWLRLIIITGSTFLLFGFWPARMWHNWQTGVAYWVSADVFPWGVPIGLVLLYLAWRHKSPNYHYLLIGYFFVPYLYYPSIFVYLVIVFATFPTRLRLATFTAVWLLTAVILLVTLPKLNI